MFLGYPNAVRALKCCPDISILCPAASQCSRGIKLPLGPPNAVAASKCHPGFSISCLVASKCFQGIPMPPVSPNVMPWGIPMLLENSNAVPWAIEMSPGHIQHNISTGLHIHEVTLFKLHVFCNYCNIERNAKSIQMVGI